MTSWNTTFNLSQSSEIASIISGFNGFKSTVDSALSTAETGLNALSILTSLANPLVAAAQSAVTEVENYIQDLFGVGLYQLIVQFCQSLVNLLYFNK